MRLSRTTLREKYEHDREWHLKIAWFPQRIPTDTGYCWVWMEYYQRRLTFYRWNEPGDFKRYVEGGWHFWDKRLV